MTTWTELADALHNAAGPSRDLDARLWDAMSTRVHDDALAIVRNGYSPNWLPHFTDTDHIGQIICVIGEKLPGWTFGVHTHPGYAEAGLSSAHVDALSKHPRGRALTPALALCEAFCRAMAAKEDMT